MPASARRLRQARREGHLPRARDLGVVASLAGGLLLLFVYRDAALAPYIEFVRQSLLSAVTSAQQPHAARPVALSSALATDWKRGIEVVVLASLPALGGAVFASVLAHTIRLRGVMAWTAPAPRSDRLNPATQFRTLFSVSTSVELLKSMFKACVLLVCLGLVIRMALPALVHVPRLDPAGIVAALERLLIQTLTPVLGVFLWVAALDTGYQLRRWRGQLRMTPEEVRREQRDDQGHPQWRAQIRAGMQ